MTRDYIAMSDPDLNPQFARQWSEGPRRVVRFQGEKKQRPKKLERGARVAGLLTRVANGEVAGEEQTILAAG